MSNESLLKQTFLMRVRDNSDEIETVELDCVCTECGLTLSDEQIAAHVKYFDENKNGRISFADFISKIVVNNSGH